jgi:hypothetical protein
MQPIDLDARDPFWGILAIGTPIERVRRELAEAIAAYREDYEFPSPSNTAIVVGADTVALYSFVRADAPFELAEALRARDLEVFVCVFTKDDDIVFAWDGMRFDHDFDRSPRQLAEQRGITQPSAPFGCSRPRRQAGLAVGRSVDEVRAIVGERAELLAVPRGVVVLDAPPLIYFDEFESGAIETYDMTHYLDSGEVCCTVTRGDSCKTFEYPIQRDAALHSIDGLTDPHAIAHSLGIPITYLFPTPEWSLGGEAFEARIDVDGAELAPGVHRGRDYRDGAPVLVTFATSFDPLAAKNVSPYLVSGPGVCDLVVCEREVLVERLPVDTRPATQLTPWPERELIELARAVAYTVVNSTSMIETIRPELVFVTADRRFAALAPRGPRFRGELIPAAAPIANAVREIAETFTALGASPALAGVLTSYETPFELVIALGDHLDTL